MRTPSTQPQHAPPLCTPHTARRRARRPRRRLPPRPAGTCTTRSRARSSGRRHGPLPLRVRSVPPPPSRLDPSPGAGPALPALRPPFLDPPPFLLAFRLSKGERERACIQRERERERERESLILLPSSFRSVPSLRSRAHAWYPRGRSRAGGLGPPLPATYLLRGRSREEAYTGARPTPEG